MNNSFIPEEETWKLDAVCAGMDADIFFPDDGQGVTEAQKICAICLVRTECLEYALEHKFAEGVWGGTSERERKRIIRRRKKRAISYTPLPKGA